MLVSVNLAMQIFLFLFFTGCEDKCTKYDLIGVICHHGTAGGERNNFTVSSGFISVQFISSIPL